MLFLLASLFMNLPQAVAFDHMHADWTQVLKNYQNADGLVKYAALKADKEKKADHPFTRYLSSLSAVKKSEYEKWSRNQQLAFLINAYNAYTVELILHHYPVSGIKKIGGLFKKPWSIEFFSLLEGEIKSLDPIEHDWIRPKFKDYRIHAAVNCASLSCPPLRREAYVAERLDQQLDDQMRLWLKDPTRNQIDLDTKKAHLSKIFDWYKDDFVKWGGSVAKVLAKYTDLTDAQAGELQINYLKYDWSLNEAK